MQAVHDFIQGFISGFGPHADFILGYLVLMLVESITSTSFLIWYFFKVTRLPKAGFKNKFFLGIISVLLYIPAIFGSYGILITTLASMLLFYLRYRRYDHLAIVNAVISGTTFYLVIWILQSIIFNILLKARLVTKGSAVRPWLAVLIFIIFYLFAIIFVKKKASWFYHQITGKNARSFLVAVGYSYFSAGVIVILNMLYGESSQVLLLYIFLLLTQIGFAFYMYFINTKIQTRLLDEQEQQNLQEYLHDLEQSEDQLRRFKHDYPNLLASLRTSAESGANQELVAELDRYTESQLNQQNLWKYKNLNHLHNDALKSLLVEKLNRLNELGIKYSFECEQEITTVPKNVKLFDLVRIIGIVFDNAIEESQKVGTEQAEVKAMFYQEEPGELEFELKNKSRLQQVNLTQIKEKGYTTKEHHQGLGLANIQEINDQYDNMFIEYGSKNNWFSFSLVIA
ncbi:MULTISPECIES: sensor histidine kinase [Lactobacillus]|uniref:GHKL domain-containing protein n=1 Tax=Lactobacillus xujianguonis TaxID=2495899 RepID=A0A437SX50_9LACO|nr:MULTISPECIES: GHKL domain-containing protein [Lactobacillus]RVU71430.1 GHKL domain-containing protein [Lactobacillus xujianguonis]